VIKDIVVHLTGSEEDEKRLACAELISERFEAHLRGLYVYVMPELMGSDPVLMAGVPAMTLFYEEASSRAEEGLKRLKERFKLLLMPHDVQQLDVFAGTAGETLALKARTADIFVATRPYGDPADELHVEISVLFNSGRSCLFVPPGRAPAKWFGTIMVAWNGSRESARALAEAMPFLKLATTVSVVTVVEQGDDAKKSDIARHLSRHGVSVVLQDVTAGAEGAGPALLAEASRLGADMLVMGGYGHSRFREWVLGGTTRYVLETADIPVLMAR